MRNKIILLVGAILVFGLAFAAYAINTTVTADAAKTCCCSGDSCPMKNKDAAGKQTASTSDQGCSCCGDSCPMKNKDASGAQVKCDCCGDSCPMITGQADDKGTKADSGRHAGVVMAEGKSCPMMKAEGGHKMEAGMKHEMSADGTMSCCKKAKTTAANPAL